ncbi:MAG: HNH endonuclease signature motif containing protein [Pseudomonadota bacterium]
MARRRTRFVPPKADPPHGMAVQEYRYRRRNRREYRDIKGQFTKVRGDFLADLAQFHEQELKAWGIRPDEIDGMRDGIVPEGFSVHHIKPLDSTGGTNEFHNLVLIPQKPYHDAIHAYLNPQVAGIKISRERMVKLPIVKGPIYQPSATELEAYATARRDSWRANRQPRLEANSMAGIAQGGAQSPQPRLGR